MIKKPTTQSKKLAADQPPIQPLFTQFCEAAARLIEHPACPRAIRGFLSELDSNLFNEASDVNPGKKLAVDIRHACPQWMMMILESEAQAKRAEAA